MKAPFKLPVISGRCGRYFQVNDAAEFHLLTTDYQSHADFIATAINSHEALVESLAKFMSWLDDGWLVRDITKDAQPDWAINMMHFVSDLNKAKSALANAGESS